MIKLSVIVPNYARNTWLNLSTQLSYHLGWPSHVMLISVRSFLGCKHHFILKKFGSWFAPSVAYQHSLEVPAMCTMHAFHVASAMRFLDCRCWEVEINHLGAFLVKTTKPNESCCHIVSILIELQNKEKPAWLNDMFFLDVLVFYDSDWFVLVYLTSPSCTFHATSSKVSNVIAASHWQNREPWISKSQRLVK